MEKIENRTNIFPKEKTLVSYAVERIRKLKLWKQDDKAFAIDMLVRYCLKKYIEPPTVEAINWRLQNFDRVGYFLEENVKEIRKSLDDNENHSYESLIHEIGKGSSKRIKEYFDYRLLSKDYKSNG